jgi:hypothetical protein
MELHAIHLILLVLAVLAVSFWSYREGVAYGRKLANVPAGTGFTQAQLDYAAAEAARLIRIHVPRRPSVNVHERPLTAAYHDQPPETGHPMLCGCPRCR